MTLDEIYVRLKTCQKGYCGICKYKSKLCMDDLIDDCIRAIEEVKENVRCEGEDRND